MTKNAQKKKMKNTCKVKNSMTSVELADKFIHLIQTKHWNNPELKDAYNALCEVAIVNMNVKDGQFLGIGEISFFKEHLPAREFYVGIYNAEYLLYEDNYLGLLDFRDCLYYRQSLFCVVSDLQDIVKEVKQQYQIIANEGIAKSLLMNPRKEVVEWALAHKDELKLTKEDYLIVEKHLVLPELKALIRKSLLIDNEK